MITVYYCATEDVHNAVCQELGGLSLAEEHMRSIAACGKETEQKRRWLGRMLAAFAFYERTGAVRLPAFSYEENGKPYLAQQPDFCFNISHSGSLAVCAVSEERVGVDVQQHRSAAKGIAARFFSAEEKEQLAAASGEERERLFFRIWSAKEAYVKYTGQGMRQGFASFTADLSAGAAFDEKSPGGPAAFFTEPALPGWEDYFLTVCTGKRDVTLLRECAPEG